VIWVTQLSTSGLWNLNINPYTLGVYLGLEQIIQLVYILYKKEVYTPYSSLKDGALWKITRWSVQGNELTILTYLSHIFHGTQNICLQLAACMHTNVRIWSWGTNAWFGLAMVTLCSIVPYNCVTPSVRHPSKVHILKLLKGIN
jgi:hypothetical protein